MKTCWLVLCLLLSQAVYAQTGTGTPADPIIAMSCDPAQVAKDVRASLAFYGRTDDGYWVGIANHTTGPFSNGLWYCGWNRYWEDRAAPGNNGSANPADANLPALHRDGGAPPTPPVQPPAPTVDLSVVYQRLDALSAQLEVVHHDLYAQTERGYLDLVARLTVVTTQATAIDAKVQTLQAAAAGRSMLGTIGGALGAVFSNPAVLTGIGAVVTCVITKKCG